MSKGVEELNSVIIEIDKTLEFSTPKTRKPAEFNKEISQVNRSNEDGSTIDKSFTKEVVRDCIFGDFRHKNYLTYLKMCWSTHYGIILKPDFIWYTILGEISQIICKSHQTYRELFTDSSEIKEIKVLTGDPQLISLNLLISELKKLVPLDIETFLPSFTTSNLESEMAFNAAFCEMSSPFYNYSMYLCGISKVKVYGTHEDWNKIVLLIEKIKEIMLSLKGGIDKDLENYFSRIINITKSIVTNLREDSQDFWKNIFELERCGSGGQVEVKGWFRDFYYILPSVKYVENFSSSISKVSYTYLPTGQKYELSYGLFSSNISQDYLDPEFGYIINEIK